MPNSISPTWEFCTSARHFRHVTFGAIHHTIFCVCIFSNEKWQNLHCFRLDAMYSKYIQNKNGTLSGFCLSVFFFFHLLWKVDCCIQNRLYCYLFMPYSNASLLKIILTDRKMYSFVCCFFLLLSLVLLWFAFGILFECVRPSACFVCEMFC